jgi:8-oxo-dGTP pyrophosphatase MutT (NUDIX family)
VPSTEEDDEAAVDASDQVPRAIPAATVVIVRDGASGLETLMLRRNARGQFGGMWVFPGGQVEAADIAAVAPGDELGAARQAAAREAAEEAGLPVDPASLAVLSHWMPPPLRRKRFSTWFFVTACPAGTVVVDGVEIHEHAWLPPAEVLKRREAGELEVVAPTWVTLWQLSGHETVAHLQADVAGVEPEHFATRPTVVDGTPVLLWHGDAGYVSGDPTMPGPRHRLWMAADGWSYERTGARRPPGPPD